MKKILFASTALVAAASVAAADVAVTGAVEMGVVGGNRYNNATVTGNNVGGTTKGRDAGAEFWTSHEVTFAMTGEADNGLTFGATVQLDESTASGGRDDQGAFVFIAFGAAKLTMGDTDGALDWALQEVNLAGGSIDDSETEHPGFNGNSGYDAGYDNQVARFEYSFGDFAAAMSVEIDDTGTNDPIYGIGFKYSADLGGVDLGVGLGYQTRDNLNNTRTDEALGISVDAGLSNGLSMGVSYMEMSGGGQKSTSHTGVGVAYEMNALTVALNYGIYDMPGSAEASGTGMVVNYDLGGGLVVQFGAGVGETKTAGGATTDWDSFSLGLAMSF